MSFKKTVSSFSTGIVTFFKLSLFKFIVILFKIFNLPIYLFKLLFFDNGSNLKSELFFYHFGCFYRYAIGDIINARKCFEQSLAQKINFAACIELAELEAAEGNLKQAEALLASGLAIIPITRPENEEREKLSDRITALQTLLNLPELKD